MTETLALVPSGIDTYRQPVVYMHEDCHICRAEGFAAETRIRIDLRDRWIIATLNVVARGAWLAVDQAALSVSADMLGICGGCGESAWCLGRVLAGC